MTSPTLRSYGVANSENGSAFGAISLTTVTNDIVVVAASFFTNQPEADVGVSGITGGGVTGSWTLRNRTYITCNDGVPLIQEVWWGLATTGASSVTVAINNATTTYDTCMVFSVAGAKTTAPFDVNVSLPAVASSPESSQVTTRNVTGVSTTASGTLLIAILTGNNEPSSIPVAYATADSDFTLIAADGEQAASFLGAGSEYQALSGPITSQTFNLFAGLDSTDWIGYVDAIQAAVIAGPTGTWASTEAADAMAAHGGVLGGSWHSTEAKDIFDFTSAHPSGTWGSTETADTLAAAGTGATATYFDPATVSEGVSLQNDNLTAINQEAFNESVGARSNTFKTTGKFYTEFSVEFEAGESGVGVINAAAAFGNWANPVGPATNGAGVFASENGTIWINGQDMSNWAGTSLSSNTQGLGPNDNTAVNVGVAIDLDNNLIWFRVAGGLWNGISGANPANGVASPRPPTTGQPQEGSGGYDISMITGSAIYLFAGLYGPEDTAMLNAGASAFAHTPPSGFSAWDTATPPASPLMIDGYATGGAAGGGPFDTTGIDSATVTLTTTQHNDVIVVGITAGGAYTASPITSITDTAGLVWKRRNQRWQQGGLKAGPGTEINKGAIVELWWAHAPNPLSGDVITVHATGGEGAFAVLAFGVAGANYTTPFDTHTQAGGYVDGSGGFFNPSVSQLATNADNTLLFGFHGIGVTYAGDGGVAQDPWTYVTATALETETDGYGVFGSLVYQTVTEPQLGTAVLVGGPIYAGTEQPYSSAGVMFDSIVAAGESGTAEEIYWFWDNGSVSGSIQLSTTTDLVLTYTVVNFNLMVLIQVMIKSASGTGEVTSISEGQGSLSSAGFERRSRVVTATPGGTIATEIWWGWMPMYTQAELATNDTITINTSGTAAGDLIAAQILGLGGSTGAYGLGDAFWDTNPALPVEVGCVGASPPPNASDISTSELSTLLVAWTSNLTEAVPGFTEPFVALTLDTPNTILPRMQYASDAPPVYMGFEYLYSSGLASDETAEFLQSPEPDGWIVIADAIPVGPPQPPTGVWESVEHTDVWSAHGFVPVQVAWHSTDHADEFTGAPGFAPYFGEGWLGWVKAYAAWASTEHKDTMGFSGWLINNRITGQMGAYESDDRLSLSNRSTVTGTWGSVEYKDRWSSAGFEIPKAYPPAAIKRRLLIIT